MKNTEAVEDTLGITDAIMELWNNAKPNPNWTTSQKLEAVDPELAKAYRLNKEIRDAVKQIQADMRANENKKRGLLRGLWNAFSRGFGVIKSEGDKLFKE